MRTLPLLALAATFACASAASSEPPANDPAPPASTGDEAAPPSPQAAATPAPPILAAHNRMRAAHCAPPLRWSAQLEASAQAWANELVNRGCAFEHSRGSYGENLAGGTAGGLDAEAVTQMWYREVEAFDFARGGFSMETGHFTQLVWVGTSELGCGQATCNGLDLWVCQYGPPGNVQGQYRQNVLPTSCR
ncbi:MAG: hypothetical protein H6722_12895 [Sandaracinus sp.]|nr:hypothetical protein [Myxococcales bacterium]MCB9603111.1 hypothetical protein [Sandaracinus sp.]MCB9613340.1 hypothetical protein [Sandaracinus sp.]